MMFAVVLLNKSWDFGLRAEVDQVFPISATSQESPPHRRSTWQE